MLESNSFIDLLKGNGGKVIGGLIAAILIACGIVFPNLAQSDRIDVNEADIGEVNDWRYEFYGVEWAAHLEDFAVLVADVDANLAAFTEYAELNDANIEELNADILVINAWITTFYNDDEEALGEWQEFMAVWTDFYNKDYGSLGEFQETINGIYANYAGWANAFNARLNALEGAEEPEV